VPYLVWARRRLLKVTLDWPIPGCCLFHPSSRAAARMHHPQFHIRLSRTAILPPSSALHLLRSQRTVRSKSGATTFLLLKFYRESAISPSASSASFPTRQPGSSSGAACALRHSSPFPRTDAARTSRPSRILASAHSNSLQGAVTGLILSRRDRIKHLCRA
jgi:hypothetical protein